MLRSKNSSKIWTRSEELRAEYIDLPPGDLIKQREEHMIKSLRKWLSDTTSDQEQVVTAWSKQLQPIGSEWIQYRDKIQEEAIHLLKQREDLPDFEQRFAEILVHPERMRSVGYREKTLFNTKITLKLAVQIIHLMTSEQRTHLLKRIGSLAEDFEKIECDR